MLFDGYGVGKSSFFGGGRVPGASGDDRGTAGFQYQNYGERGGWTQYEYPDDEYVPVSGEVGGDNYVLEEVASAGSFSNEVNEIEYGDVGDRRISVDGERSGTYSSLDELRTTSVPTYTYKTTIKYKTTVTNESLNYVRLGDDHNPTATETTTTEPTLITTSTKTTVTTTTTTTRSTSSTTVIYIENGKKVHWPRVPTSSFIDQPEHENEIPEGTTPRETTANIGAAEDRDGSDFEENRFVQKETSPKTTVSSTIPESTSTSTVKFPMPEIRVTYVPPDKREADGDGARDTTEKVLTGGVLFAGGSDGAENAAERFMHPVQVTPIFCLILTFLTA